MIFQRRNRPRSIIITANIESNNSVHAQDERFLTILLKKKFHFPFHSSSVKQRNPRFHTCSKEGIIIHRLITAVNVESGSNDVRQEIIKKKKKKMLGGIEEESTRAPVNSQWLIAHTYKRRPSHRYIYPWRFHVGKKSFFLGSSNAQGTGFHVSSPSSPTPLASPRRANPLLLPSSTASILLLSTTTPGLEQFYEFLMRRGLQHRGETTRNFLSRALSRIRPSFLRPAEPLDLSPLLHPLFFRFFRRTNTNPSK